MSPFRYCVESGVGPANSGAAAASRTATSAKTSAGQDPGPGWRQRPVSGSPWGFNAPNLDGGQPPCQILADNFVLDVHSVTEEKFYAHGGDPRDGCRNRTSAYSPA